MNQNEIKIQDAIRNRNLIKFSYEDLSRTIEPYTLGVAKKGTSLLAGFQIAGQSKTEIHEWKLFDVNKIADLAVISSSRFSIRGDYKRGDKRMTEIICEV